MLIAQITDIHLGFDPGNPGEFNAKRLTAVVRALAETVPQPDLLLVTGDLVDRGDDESYRRLKTALEGVSIPTHMVLGNHDIRAAFSARFPHVPLTAQGHVQYFVERDGLRFVMLDTLEEGRHGGSFCRDRADWLAARLAEAPDTPTVIVMHHPPIDTVVPWMTIAGDEPWIDRLRAAMAGHGQIVGILTGHIHRAMVGRFAGVPLVACSSTAPQVALELAPIDEDAPDERPMIVADAPAYALHWWNGRELVTHFATAEAHVCLARYDAGMQPLVRHLAEERMAG